MNPPTQQELVQEIEKLVRLHGEVSVKYLPGDLDNPDTYLFRVGGVGGWMPTSGILEGVNALTAINLWGEWKAKNQTKS